MSLFAAFNCLAVALCVGGLLAAFGPAYAAAQTPSKAIPKNGKDAVSPVLRAMLADYRRYAEGRWHTPSTAGSPAPKTGWWGSGKADGGNEGVRAQANTALVYALLFREGDRKIAVADRVEPALRYAAAIHVTGNGSIKATDNKAWGDSWQSAMWAANLGVAAFLARDRLAPETRDAVARVVAHEADRFVDAAPPTREPGDTKSEENAWNLTAPAAALLLLPNDPRAKGWDNAVKRFGFNTLSVAGDKTNARVEDGKPVRDWVTTEQVFSDFTLENHGIFHPVYAMVGPATLAQAAVAYRLANQPIPDALRHNVLSEWEMLQSITLSDGEWLYPQGLDWDFHDYEHLHYWTMLATMYRDPYAALLEQRTIGYARRRQEINGDGSFVGPSGGLGFAREAVQAERVAFTLLMHEQFGSTTPASDSAFAAWQKSLPPTHVWEPAGFVVTHTPRGVFSFSWKNRLMGLVVPSANQHFASPYVTTPYAESLVGHFRLEGQTDADSRKWTVHSHEVIFTKNGFIATIDADINNGKLRQQIKVEVDSSGVLGYLDQIRARSDVTVTEEQGLTVAIENDDASGNIRHIFGPGNTAKPSLIIKGGSAGDHPFSGAWANIDGRLGLIVAPLRFGDTDTRRVFLREVSMGLIFAPATAKDVKNTGGPALFYRAVGAPNRAGAREDFLYGRLVGKETGTAPRSFKAGEIVAERAGLLLPNATPTETARLSAQVILTRPTKGGIIFHYVDYHGVTHTLEINTLYQLDHMQKVSSSP